jgi:hypothetical protein
MKRLLIVGLCAGAMSALCIWGWAQGPAPTGDAEDQKKRNATPSPPCGPVTNSWDDTGPEGINGSFRVDGSPVPNGFVVEICRDDDPSINVWYGTDLDTRFTVITDVRCRTTVTPRSFPYFDLPPDPFSPVYDTGTAGTQTISVKWSDATTIADDPDLTKQLIVVVKERTAGYADCKVAAALRRTACVTVNVTPIRAAVTLACCANPENYGCTGCTGDNGCCNTAAENDPTVVAARAKCDNAYFDELEKCKTDHPCP